MESVANRDRVHQPRVRRYLVFSVVLHLLALVAVNLVSMSSKRLRPPHESPPIRVSFVRPPLVEEPQHAQVLAEAPSQARTPDGLASDRAQETKTVVPLAPAPSAAPPPAPSIPAQAEPQAPAPPMPAEAKKPPPPQVTPKGASPAPRREVEARRASPAPARTQRQAAERPPLDRLARLPEPSAPFPRPSPRLAPQPPLSSMPGQRSGMEPDQQTIHGRIPLLSGDDLEKYARVRSSEQRSSGGQDVSLNTREIKYLSYFAHIKRKIERVWGYPRDAAADGTQGQLQLRFVLSRTGQIKTVELLRSSGHMVLDKEAWDAVVNAGPFDPFPPVILDGELYITARFTYVLDASVQRILGR